MARSKKANKENRRSANKKQSGKQSGKQGGKQSGKITQKEKTKFRATKEWRDFRKQLKEKQKVDPLSLKSLTKTCNCHHRDLDATHYTDISNEEHFVMVNNYSHKCLHYLYNIYKNDKDVIKRLELELEKMYKINCTN